MTFPGSASARAIDARDRLLKSATVIAAGFTAANFYYPRSEATDGLPSCTIERSMVRAERATNGGSSSSGTIRAVFAFAASTTDGALEDFADAVCRDIVEDQTDGLWVLGAEAERCGAPGPGFFAASDQTGQADQGQAATLIELVITWGDGM
jgi:hypothetical protein